MLEAPRHPNCHKSLEVGKSECDCDTEDAGHEHAGL